MDHSLDLAPMWILALRADLPLLAKDPISSSSPDGDYLNGVGNAEVQAVIIHNLNKRRTVGFGTRLIMLTAETRSARKNGRSCPRLVCVLARGGASTASNLFDALSHEAPVLMQKRN
jgi:hypothetical protein